MPQLNVPYFAQPTGTTCQASCLKMIATYLENRFGVSSPASDQSIEAIKTEINSAAGRPSAVTNAHANFAWWLNKNFGAQGVRARVVSNQSEAQAQDLIEQSIDHGWPVMVGVQHARVAGHIIIVYGYDTMANFRSGGSDFLCHDPYGRFHPELGSKLYGARRREGGQSLASGGERAPGAQVWYSLAALARTNKAHWDLILLR